MFEGWRHRSRARAQQRAELAAEEKAAKERQAQKAADQTRRQEENLREQRQRQQQAETAAEAARVRAQRKQDLKREAERTPKARVKRTAPAGAPVDVAVEAHLTVDLEHDADMWRDVLVTATRKHIRPGEQVLGVYVDPFKKRTVYVALTDGFVVRAGAKSFRSNAPIEQLVPPRWNVRVGGDVGLLDNLDWADEWLGQIRTVRKTLKRQTAQAAERAGRGTAVTPQPRLIRTARDAELVAAEWMQVMGFPDARATGQGADGGIDVLAEGAIGQVKAEAKPVGRPVLQQLAGAAGSMRRLGVCFALSGYTPQALGWSQGQNLALFSFDLQGVPVPVNEHATALMAEATGT